LSKGANVEKYLQLDREAIICPTIPKLV
jgi:hypothetical protein